MSVWVTSVLFSCCLFADGQGSTFNTPGNILIADQFNNRVIEVNPRTGTMIYTYRGHNNTVDALSWSPNGRYIASGSWDHTVQVWAAPSTR